MVTRNGVVVGAYHHVMESRTHRTMILETEQAFIP